MRRRATAVDRVARHHGRTGQGEVNGRDHLVDARFAANGRSTTDPVRHLHLGPADAFTIVRSGEPRDLRGAPLTLSGTVRATAGCVVLDTATGRWLLLGPAVAALHDGAPVTVRGRPATLLPGCDPDHALTVQQIS
jgi:hypothetical protein